MRADNSHHLKAAARRRALATRERAVRALRRFDAAGEPVTIDTVARTAQVSRSWLYSQPDLRAEIQRRATVSNRAGSVSVPARQRASDASLRQRLQTATERIRQLTAENRQLRQQLAVALGERRATRAPSST
jgi:hypothetical protein